MEDKLIWQLQQQVKAKRDDINMTFHKGDLEEFDKLLREYENLIKQLTIMGLSNK